MASEIRVNQIQNRSGLGTVTFTDTGAVLSGIVTVPGNLKAPSQIDAGTVNATTVTGDIAGNVTAPTSINVGVTTFHSTTAFVHDINSTGVVTATAFRGDASQLTGLPAGFTELDAALFN